MAEYLVLKNKDNSVADYAAVVPDGWTEDDVLEAWKPYGWTRGNKTNLPDVLAEQLAPTAPAEPVTTTKEK